MREQPEAGGRTLYISKTHPEEIPLHLRGNPIEQIEPLFLFGAPGGGAGPLRQVQFGPKTRHVFVLPGVQNALGLPGRICSAGRCAVCEDLRLL
jgi:hypothetical protein